MNNDIAGNGRQFDLPKIMTYGQYINFEQSPDIELQDKLDQPLSDRMSYFELGQILNACNEADALRLGILRDNIISAPEAFESFIAASNYSKRTYFRTTFTNEIDRLPVGLVTTYTKDDLEYYVKTPMGTVAAAAGGLMLHDVSRPHNTSVRKIFGTAQKYRESIIDTDGLPQVPGSLRPFLSLLKLHLSDTSVSQKDMYDFVTDLGIPTDYTTYRQQLSRLAKFGMLHKSGIGRREKFCTLTKNGSEIMDSLLPIVQRLITRDGTIITEGTHKLEAFLPGGIYIEDTPHILKRVSKATRSQKKESALDRYNNVFRTIAIESPELCSMQLTTKELLEIAKKYEPKIHAMVPSRLYETLDTKSSVKSLGKDGKDVLWIIKPAVSVNQKAINDGIRY